MQVWRVARAVGRYEGLRDLATARLAHAPMSSSAIPARVHVSSQVASSIVPSLIEMSTANGSIDNSVSPVATRKVTGSPGAAES